MTVHPAKTAPSAGSDDRLGEIARALGAGFHELDALGRLPSATASHLLDRIHAQRDLALLSPAYLSEAFLGRFEELPADAQAGIRAAISHRDLIHLSGQEFGPSFLRYLRTLWRVKLWMNARAQRGGRLARAGSTAADVVCYASRRLPGHASTTARRVSSRLAGWSSRGRSLATVLACTGLDESDLVVDFARGVAQPRRYRAYWHDASRNDSVVKLVGIDFIRSEQGCWLVEANVNPALVLERSQLYRRDPLGSVATFVGWRGSGRSGGPAEEGRGLVRSRQHPFKGRQFTAEVILWAVRWYLQFPISYRDLERMLADRGVSVDHTTLFRWIQVYAPSSTSASGRICA